MIALLMTDLPFYTDPVKYPNTYLSSPLIPVLLSLFIGYIVASVFFNVRSAAAFISWNTMLCALCQITNMTPLRALHWMSCSACHM